MKNKMMMIAMVVSTTLLAGCSDDESKIQSAIQSKVENNFCLKGEKDQNGVMKAVTYATYKDVTSFNPQSVLLAITQSKGYVDVKKGNTYKPGYDIQFDVTLTEAGKKAGVWDEKDGLCLAKKIEVTKLHTVTPPDAQNKSNVTFNYKLTDLASWINKSQFEKDIVAYNKMMKGNYMSLDGSSMATAVVIKTTDGWEVAPGSINYDMH